MDIIYVYEKNYPFFLYLKKISIVYACVCNLLRVENRWRGCLVGILLFIGKAEFQSVFSPYRFHTLYVTTQPFVWQVTRRSVWGWCTMLYASTRFFGHIARKCQIFFFFLGCGWHDVLFLSRIVYCQLKMVYIMKICKPWWRFIIMSADKMLLSKHEYFEWCFKTITITSVETVYRKRIKKKISEFFSKVLFQKCISIF